MAGRKKAEKPVRERLSDWLYDHRTTYETNGAFARACQISEGRLSQILSGDLPSPALAVRIEKATSRDILSADWFANLTAQVRV